jgi:hypothetical protein
MAKLGASKSVVKTKNPEKTLLSKMKLRDEANLVVGMSCLKSGEWAPQNYTTGTAKKRKISMVDVGDGRVNACCLE